MSTIQLADEVTHGKVFFSISTFDGRETYHEILKVTEEFNEAYCIGKGGCGSVYKAKLGSGDIVANTTSKHRETIRYCFHRQNSCLVYDYLEGGSLSNNLSDNNAKSLDWAKRVNIIKDVAHALSYIHHGCSPPIVHRDISSKNILLDSEYEACVSDFDTSKILNPDSSN
ncbi:MDIS1-interacting receptor like kinase 2-like protein [Tanacetum coccineum]